MIRTTYNIASTLSCNIQNERFIVSWSRSITKAGAFIWLCAAGAQAERWHTMKRQESNYFNPIFIAESSPNCRHRIGGDENLLALEGWPLGSSKFEKGQNANCC